MFDNLRAEMARRNKTLKDVGNLLGISLGAVSLKLNGKSQFTLKEICILAKEFNCSLDYLAETNIDEPAKAAV